MRKKILHIIILLLALASYACTEIYEQPKYQPPNWLAVNLYTQILTQQNLSRFALCLELTGYDTIIDVTGSYTVFAPTNDAFTIFFSEHPEYGNNLEQIPLEVLRVIVKSHIIQNAWSREQLAMLDLDGWIDSDDPRNNEPSAYKKQTLLREDNSKYWERYRRKQYTIVDSINSNEYKRVFTKSRKYSPVYFKELFEVYSISSSDYEYYFGRPFTGDNIYYADALVVEEEIFAENGFIYMIDRVAQPLLNG